MAILEAVKLPKQQLFSDSIESILAEAGALTVLQTVQPVVLLTRAIARGPPDTQTFDTLLSAAGKLITDGGILGTGSGLAGAGFSSWVGMAVGDYRWVGTGSTAGNALATLPSVATAFGASTTLFEVLEVLWAISCDATVANRICTLSFLTGLPVGVVTALNDWQQVGPTSSASEKGKIFVPRGPAVVKLNDNGVFADGATSPLPLQADGDALTISATVAAGVAGDSHGLAALIHRIA